MTKKEFLLKDLGCANCAAKMEAQIRRLEEIDGATVDFIAKKLTIAMDSDVDLTQLMQKITHIINQIEPEVQLITLDSETRIEDRGEYEEDSSRRNEIIRLVVCGIFLAVAAVVDIAGWQELVLYLTGYLIVGWDVILRAIKGIGRGQVFSEHFLMSVATIGAFFIGEYAEAVAVMLFYLVGELFQDMATDHSRKSIKSLMDIKPDYANLKIDDGWKKTLPEMVDIGDHILVKPGEKIPLDGTVTKGLAMVDTAALTGESTPRQLGPGSEALSGFVSINGVLEIEVTKTFGDSTVSKILYLVQNASGRKAPTEKLITKFARYYTPLVVFGALALALIPPLVIPGATFTDWIYRALVFLVVSCPCALVISIPLGFFGGIGGASKRGILVKGSNYLDALNQVEMVVFDKTGTLTKGVFQVTAINPHKGFNQGELMEYAAYAESFSNHPIANSINQAYGGIIDKSRIENIREMAGLGIKAKINGKEVLVGNSKMMMAERIAYYQVDTIGTIVHVAVDHKYAGNIIISDEVKEDSAQAIQELKELGIKRVIMLTGDQKTAAEAIGNQLGLDEIYAELLPTDKVAKIESLESERSPKGKIAFVGDGINDAPVLARADLGIAMGALGSDAAIEAADIVIMNDEPSKVSTAIKVARRTRGIVLQNIVFALGVKAIFLGLGSFGLTSMWEAVFADIGVALIAIFNALRAMNTKNL